jgi:hypothetical protein
MKGKDIIRRAPEKLTEKGELNSGTEVMPAAYTFFNPKKSLLRDAARLNL